MYAVGDAPAMSVPTGGGNDTSPSIPDSGGTITDGGGYGIAAPTVKDGGAGTSSATETVAQAYLAALAAQGKNTSGDTAPYVVIPNQANPSGSGSGLMVVLVVAAIGGGVWWFMHRKKGA